MLLSCAERAVGEELRRLLAGAVVPVPPKRAESGVEGPVRLVLPAAVVVELRAAVLVLNPIEEASPVPPDDRARPELVERVEEVDEEPDDPLLDGVVVEPTLEAARPPPAGDDALGLLLETDVFELLVVELVEVDPPLDAAREPLAGDEEDGPLLDDDAEEVEPPPDAAREPPAGDDELGPLLVDDLLDELLLPAAMEHLPDQDAKSPPRW